MSRMRRVGYLWEEEEEGKLKFLWAIAGCIVVGGSVCSRTDNPDSINRSDEPTDRIFYIRRKPRQINIAGGRALIEEEEEEEEGSKRSHL